MLTLIAAALLLVGCTRPVSSEAPDFEGYVTKKENQRILVVSSTPKDFSSTGGIREFYDAIWLSNAPKDVRSGQKVQVWYAGPINTSYPGQGKAKQVRILPGTKPKGAILTEDQVIGKVISSSPDIKVMVIKQVIFNAERKIWTVQLREGLDSNAASERVMEIEDK